MMLNHVNLETDGAIVLIHDFDSYFRVKGNLTSLFGNGNSNRLSPPHFEITSSANTVKFTTTLSRRLILTLNNGHFSKKKNDH